MTGRPICSLALLQLRQILQHLLAMLGWFHAGEDFRDLPFVDQEIECDALNNTGQRENPIKSLFTDWVLAVGAVGFKGAQ
jgi:hypothetical protein